jgi:hypothetical protein
MQEDQSWTNIIICIVDVSQPKAMSSNISSSFKSGEAGHYYTNVVLGVNGSPSLIESPLPLFSY